MMATWRLVLLPIALLLSACGGTAAPAQSTTAGSSGSAAGGGIPASDFAGIVSAANREGSLIIWGSYPRDPDVQRVQDAFNKHFNVNVKIQFLSMPIGNAASRLMADSQAGRNDVDFVSQFSTDMIPELVDKGMLAKVDWPGTFAKELPDITEAYNGAYEQFRGYYVNFYDGAYGLVYNTKQIKPQDLPKRWADLAGPAFKGKFYLDARGYPFNYLVLHPDWGPEKTEKLVRDIAANGPSLQGDASQLVDIVARGEAPFGTAVLTSALDGKAHGQPVDVAVLDYLPIDPRVTAVAAKAPHPNAARLFVAWQVTEGMTLYNDLYRLARVSQPGSTLDALVKQNSSAKIAAAHSIDDVKASAAFLKKTGDILTGVK
jgi:iron(III) transport system substrate-binding protein